MQALGPCPKGRFAKGSAVLLWGQPLLTRVTDPCSSFKNVGAGAGRRGRRMGYKWNHNVNEQCDADGDYWNPDQVFE
jgi:hypothetical protein